MWPPSICVACAVLFVTNRPSLERRVPAREKYQNPKYAHNLLLTQAAPPLRPKQRAALRLPFSSSSLSACRNETKVGKKNSSSLLSLSVRSFSHLFSPISRLGFPLSEGASLLFLFLFRSVPLEGERHQGNNLPPFPCFPSSSQAYCVSPSRSLYSTVSIQLPPSVDNLTIRHSLTRLFSVLSLFFIVRYLHLSNHLRSFIPSAFFRRTIALVLARLLG